MTAVVFGRLWERPYRVTDDTCLRVRGSFLSIEVWVEILETNKPRVKVVDVLPLFYGWSIVPLPLITFYVLEDRVVSVTLYDRGKEDTNENHTSGQSTRGTPEGRARSRVGDSRKSVERHG